MGVNLRQNLCTKYLKETGQSIQDFEGLCLELCDEVMKHLSKIGTHYSLLSLGGNFDPFNWSWHTCLKVDGLIHDAWCDKILPPEEYLWYMFKSKAYIDMIDGKFVSLGRNFVS